MLERVDDIRYLGIRLCSGIDIFIKHRREAELKLLQMAGMIRNASTKCADSYRVIRDLWKGVAVTKFMYGAEVLGWSVKELQRMDLLQRKVGRMALGARKFVAVEALKGEMGWSLFQDRVNKAILNFKGRVLNSNNGLAGEIMSFHINSTWHKNFKRLENKVYKTSFNSIFRQEGWKNKIIKIVEEKAQMDWRKGVESKTSLNLYKYKTFPATEYFYCGNKGSALLFAARTGSLGVRSKTYKFEKVGGKVNEENKRCLFCTSNETETLDHVFKFCVGHQGERNNLFNGIEKLIGRDRWIEECDGQDGGMLMILGFKNITKNFDLCLLTKKFLQDVWAKR